MKKLIKLFFVVTIISFVSCNSSEDDTLSGKLTVSGSLDSNGLTNLSGNDATALVTLNGKAAASFTTEALIGDEISYEVETSSANVEVVILDFFYTSGDREFWTNDIEISVDTQSSPRVATLKVLSGKVGTEVKFGFTFVLKTNGVVDMNNRYIVDPKIKVRS